MRHNTAIVIPAIAILLFSFGVIFEPQNAYAVISEEPEIDNGNAVEVHCETHYYWDFEEAFPFGERYGYGECTVIYENGEIEEIEVYVYGEFEVDATDFPLVLIEGTFSMSASEEDTDEDGIWITEVGTVEYTDFVEFEYDINTVGTELESDGVFKGLSLDKCTVETMGEGNGLFEGEAERSVWIVCKAKQGGGVVGDFVNNQQPSIGVTEKGTRVVDGGITVNGKTVDADFYFTPFPLVQADIGQPIDFVFKIWDDRLDNINHLQLQLGKGKVGESFSMEYSATYKRDKMTGEVTVTHDPIFTDVIMEQLPDQPCKTGSNDCTVIHVRVTPTEAIVGDVVFGVNIWDEAGNANTSFFNEGLQVGTETDVIIIDDSIPIVIKKQLRTDDGLGNIDKRYSEAFAMKLAWHNEQVQKKAIELGYVF